MSETTDRRVPNLRLQWLLLLLALGGALYLLAPVLMPFVAAALFAYLGDPLVDRMQPRLSRTLAVSVVFLAMSLAVVAVLLLLLPFVERQIGKFLAQLPVWLDWFQSHARPWLEAHFGVAPDVLDTQRLLVALQAHWQQAGGIAAAVLAGVSHSGMAIVGWLVNLALIPVVTFYLLRDWDLLVARIAALIPRPLAPTVGQLARESDEVLGAFLRGQLSVMVALGTYYGVALWLVGIDIGPLIGMLAGLISFVPYLGVIAGLLMSLVAALVQYQDWSHALLVFGVFGVGQVLEGYVLTPRLVGDRIGLHPVAVIFAVLAGGELFGFVGVLLALPLAAVAMVLLRYAHERYTRSALYAAGEGAEAPTVPTAASTAAAADGVPGADPPMSEAAAHDPPPPAAATDQNPASTARP